MNKEEITFLREHLKEIYEYKGLQQELTYDMSIEILNRICKALDYLQQENEKLNHYKLLYQKVKDRNEKAIEYMKPRFMNCIDNGKRYFEDYYIQEIYEILKGNNGD